MHQVCVSEPKITLLRTRARAQVVRSGGSLTLAGHRAPRLPSRTGASRAQAHLPKNFIVFVVFHFLCALQNSPACGHELERAQLAFGRGSLSRGARREIFRPACGRLWRSSAKQAHLSLDQGFLLHVSCSVKPHLRLKARRSGRVSIIVINKG